MKASWIVVLFLLVVVAVFSVQNAGEITVRFVVWQFSTSAALVILLAAFAGSLVGLVIGALSRRAPRAAPPPLNAPEPTSPSSHQNP